MDKPTVPTDVFFVGDRRQVGPDETPQTHRLIADGLQWWRSNGAPPQRTLFDIIDHPRWAAHLFLVHRLSPSVFNYRLAGEEVIQIVGFNARGLTFDSDDPEPMVAGYARYLEQVAQSRAPWLCTGQTEQQNLYILPFESLDLPLIDEAGTVTGILGLMIRDPEPPLPSRAVDPR